jgi:hypothetical protein
VDGNSAQADEKASCGAAMSEASLNERLDCRPLFGNSPGRRGLSIFWLELSSGGNRQRPTSLTYDENPRRLDREKTMESFADGIGNLIGFQLILGFTFGIYLAPSIVAVVRGHKTSPNNWSTWTRIYREIKCSAGMVMYPRHHICLPQR